MFQLIAQLKKNTLVPSGKSKTKSLNALLCSYFNLSNTAVPPWFQIYEPATELSLRLAL